MQVEMTRTELHMIVTLAVDRYREEKYELHEEEEAKKYLELYNKLSLQYCNAIHKFGKEDGE